MGELFQSGIRAIVNGAIEAGLRRAREIGIPEEWIDKKITTILPTGDGTWTRHDFWNHTQILGEVPEDVLADAIAEGHRILRPGGSLYQLFERYPLSPERDIELRRKFISLGWLKQVNNDAGPQCMIDDRIFPQPKPVDAT